MPKIRIYETDNTGTTSTDLAVLFVPGNAELVDGIMDANNCVYIPSNTTDLSKYFLDPDYDDRYADANSDFVFIDTVHLVYMLLALGYGVIYKYIPSGGTVTKALSSGEIYVKVDNSTFDDKSFKEVLKSTTLYIKNGETYKKVAKSAKYDATAEYYILKDILDTTETTSAKGDISDIVDWSFLNDKNSYDIKFITTGIFGTVPVSLVDEITSAIETYYLKLDMDDFNEDKFNALITSTDIYYLPNEETSDGSAEDMDEDNPILDETDTTVVVTESSDTILKGDFVKATEYEEGIQYYIRSASVKTYNENQDTSDIGDQGTQLYSFDFTTANRILPICANRKDCALLVDLNYYDILNGVEESVEQSENTGIVTQKFIGGVPINGNELAADWKVALEYDDGTAQTTLAKYTIDATEGKLDLSSRAYSLISNAKMSYNNGMSNLNLTVPASFVYLYEYATVNKTASSWKPIAGVQRTIVDGTFTPDLSLTKYYLDNDIITDTAGVSFNGIVNVRPYGYTLWGDRTLIEQTADKGVQATSYFSLRNLISDIAHTAYDSAITYTYETNNDITWLNFRNPIVKLLDAMVAANVLADYKIRRKPTDQQNKLIAAITLYPYLPLENFDIYTTLENAEVTIDDSEA